MLEDHGNPSNNNISVSSSYPTGSSSPTSCPCRCYRKQHAWLEEVPAPILAIERSSGRISTWNRSMIDLTGYTAKEVIDRPFAELFTDLYSEEDFGFALEKVLSGVSSDYSCDVVVRGHPQQRQQQQQHQRHNHPPKNIRLRVKLSCQRNPDNNNAIVGVLCFAEKIENPTIQQQPPSTSQNVICFLETAPVPIIGVRMLDTTTTITGQIVITFWNDKAYQLTGYAASDVMDKNLTEFCATRSQRESLVQTIQQSCIKDGSSKDVAVDFQAKYGRSLRLRLAISAPRNLDESRIECHFIYMQDLNFTATDDNDDGDRTTTNINYCSLIETANAPIFGINCDGKVDFWNLKASDVSGYTREEACECILLDTFIVHTMKESARCMIDNALHGTGTSNYELDFLTRSKEIRHLLLNATPRRDSVGNIVGVTFLAQDVTEALQRDRAIAGMAVELRQLIDTANAPIFGIDNSGCVNEWNRMTEKITGFCKEEAFDEPLVETFIAPEMQEKVQHILDEALNGNETSNYELQFITKSGEPRFLLVNATTRRDPENNIVGVVGVAQDVTEDRKHAQALREMEYLKASQEAKVETERNMSAYYAHELRNPLGAIDSALLAMPEELPEDARTLIAGMKICTTFMSTIMNNLLDVRAMEEGKMKLHSRYVIIWM